jgi:hypothetical protein
LRRLFGTQRAKNAPLDDRKFLVSPTRRVPARWQSHFHDARFAWRKAHAMKKLNREAPLPRLAPDLLAMVRGGDDPVLPPDPNDIRAHIIESGK